MFHFSQPFLKGEMLQLERGAHHDTWAAQSWTQCSLCSHPSSGQKQRITSVLLTPPLDMQPRIPLAFFAARAQCWCMFEYWPSVIRWKGLALHLHVIFLCIALCQEQLEPGRHKNSEVSWHITQYASSPHLKYPSWKMYF